jgi:hypothetical protein
MELEGDYRKNDFESILPIRPLRILIENAERLGLSRPLDPKEIKDIHPIELWKTKGFGRECFRIVDAALKHFGIFGWLLWSCPFCSGRPHVDRILKEGSKPEEDNTYLYFVRCGSCQCQTSYNNSPLDAEEKWNTRGNVIQRGGEGF